MANLKVTQIKSKIGSQKNHHATLRSLGLKKIHQSVIVEDNSQNKGYLHTVRHLIVVEPTSEALPKKNVKKSSGTKKSSVADKAKK